MQAHSVSVGVSPLGRKVDRFLGLVAVERTFFFQDSGLNSADGDYVAKKPVGSLFGQKTIQCFFAAAPRQFDS